MKRHDSRGLTGTTGPGVSLGDYPTFRFRESPDVEQEYEITRNGDPRHPDVAMRKAVGGDSCHHG
jgi:hypothetical protein